MKQITIIFIILLLGISSANADGYTAEEAEHWEKVNQMDQLAERFKVETGFTGDINPNGALSHLGGFRGKFNDIPFSASTDTTAFRHACDRIIDKLLPYTLATRNQLSRSRIIKSSSKFETEYYQTVDGYKVENGGLILISYDVGRYRFSISNGTVELPETIKINYIREEATNKAVRYHKSKCNQPDHQLIPYVIEDMRFFNSDGSGYALKYIIYIGDFVYYVDASTGRLDWDNVIGDNLSTFTIKGKVYSPLDNSIPPSVVSDSLTLSQIEVKVNGIIDHTNDAGEVGFPDSTIQTFLVNMKCGEFYLTDYSDSLKVYYSDQREEYIPGSNNYTTVIGDSCKIGTTSKLCYAPNTYWHAKDHVTQLRNLSSRYNINNAKIVTNFNFSSPSLAGQITYNPLAIRIRTGLHQSIIRHELSHHFTYKVLGENHFNTNNEQGKAMSESFANYLSCSTVPTAIMILPSGANYIATSLQNNLHISAWNLGMINEDAYNRYMYGFNLASAWWGLRSNNTDFPSDGQKDGVDTLLVAALEVVRTGIVEHTNDTYRYKPRYFYNILMSRVEDDNIPWSLNNKQVAINNAYNSRGFHFYPEVMSVASADTLNHGVRETYNVLDSIYVHVKNCPQNTKVRVFVVQDRSYETVGTNGISIPPAYVVDGNPVSIEKTTNDKGEWTGSIPFSNMLPQGDYDIIVDVGGPSAPDNMLHLVFAKDNIIDGVDGLSGEGFTKIGFGDMVVALDLSSSMQDYATHLGKTVTALVQSMIPGERINAFGFTEGTASMNWIDNGFVDLIGDSDNYFVTKEQIDTTAISSLLNSEVIEGNTDLVLPFHYGDLRLSSPGVIGNRKNIILLSDGVHFVTPTHVDFPEYPGNWTHTIGFVDTLITSVVVPDSIRCFTICYGDDPIGENNMRRFATLGNGALYHVEQLGDMKLILNQLLCSIRGTAAVVNSIKGIEPGIAQLHEIMVEPQASELRIVVIGKADTGGGAISYTLVSPSGVLFSPAENAGVCEIRNPESGIWIARVTNNTSSTSSYSILGDTRSDINLAVTPPPVSHPIDKPLLISASLKNYCTPITNSSVTARLTKDNWLIETPMYDDGNHQDGEAGDGIYANYLYPFAHGYNSIPVPGGVCNLEVYAEMPSVSARRSHVQQIYIENNTSTSCPINSRLLTRGWNWIGFPRLSDYEGGNTIPFASISLMPYLQQIISENGSATYDESGWHYNNFDYLNTQKGYKLQIHNTDQVPLYDWGAITDTTSVYTLQKDKWNWLTYPCFNAAYPEDALANVIDNIDYIMAQNWSMKIENGVWIKDSFSHRPVIKYGESILIYANEDTDFSWNSPSETPVIEPPLESQHFVFSSKPEYETLIIESANLASSKTIKEFGVFQNQECIGARCAEGFPLHLMVYSDTSSEENYPLEIHALTVDEIEIALKPLEVWDEHNTYEADILYPQEFGFRHLSLRDGDQIPTVLSMSQNYPNPFNPSTTINYAVPAAGIVTLEIYNLRGQKVKVLVNEQTLPGMYKAVWDGKDRNNRAVSSGIYFAKLEHKKKTKIQKMVLMK